MVNFFLSMLIMAFGYSMPASITKNQVHPIYVSVAEIEHNEKAHTLQVSYKIFTDDFEKTLRKTTKLKVDLINPTDRDQMNNLVNNYLQKHFNIKVNGKLVSLKFLGFENMEEGIYSYLEAENIMEVKTIEIFNNVLYEYEAEQMAIFHCKVKAQTKSSKLNNPETVVNLRF